MSENDTPNSWRPGLLIRRAADRLAAAGLPSPMVDARVLLAYVLDVEPVALATISTVPAGDAARFLDLVRQRAQWVPVQHLTGMAYFRHEKLHVGPGVFLPRPETELLVQLVIDWLAKRNVAAPVIVDLGTGSGAIAKALARESCATVHAIEASQEAFTYARRNIGRSIDLRLGSWTNAFADLNGSVDVVVSNPPYVPVGTDLPADVCRFDPPDALFAGADGLDCLREVVDVAARLLHPGGLLACEHDESHGLTAPGVIADNGRFVDIVDHNDLTGRARYVTAELGPLKLWRDLVVGS